MNACKVVHTNRLRHQIDLSEESSKNGRKEPVPWTPPQINHQVVTETPLQVIPAMPAPAERRYLIISDISLIGEKLFLDGIYAMNH